MIQFSRGFSRLRAPVAAAAVSLIVAACATTPPEPHTNEFAMIPAPAAPPRPEGAQTAAATIPLPEQPAEQPLITANDQYADLFQRLRAGYQFAPEENGPIDQQINFFVSKPDFLNRTFERGERYLYYVTTELEARHMPAELAMLPVIESSYNPYAYSRARAAGIWQFIAPTATRYQVRVNWWQDGRRDIVDSTRAALDYLEVLHQRFGDWLLAIAAYNCGEAAVQRAVDHNRDAGLPTTFWNLKLPNETRGYVPALLAMARIVEHPDWYGLAFAPIPNKPYFAQVDVPGQIDLRVAAELVGVSAGELHALNPAFNRWATDPGGPNVLLVPFDAADDFRAAIGKLSPEVRMPLERHTVLPGETMSSIGRRHELPPATISMLNPGIGASLAPGSEILLPASNIAPLRAGLIIEGEHGLTRKGHATTQHARVYVVRRGDTLWSIAKRNHVDVKQLAAMNGMKSKSALSAGKKLKLTAQNTEEPEAGHHGKGKNAHAAKGSAHAREAAAKSVRYTVKDGDSLYRISEHFDVSVAQLKHWNSLSSTRVHPGQKLVVHLDQKHDVG